MYMDKQKLFKKIDKLKGQQVEKYSSCVRKLVQKYPEYYKDKDYAKEFYKK